MNIIAVDDEILSLKTLEQAILKVTEGNAISCFDSADEALEYAKDNIVDVAFLDIEMGEIDGLTLAKDLKEIHGATNIIFVTAYSTYMGKAFNIHVSGYILKPINPEDVRNELENLRHPIKHEYKGIRIKCFGNFEVFLDGKPVLFKRSKSKEALAYLVDRIGSAVSKKELAAVVLDKDDYNASVQSYAYTVITEMNLALKNVGAEDIVIKRRGFYYIDTSKISCDFYDYAKGGIEAVNSYQGEYMTNYSWAEFTTASLSNKE